MIKFLVACAACLVSFAAGAGNISFQMALTGNVLTLTSTGDSTAFYPAVFRLLADGRWERLAPAGTPQPSAELLPGARVELLWPDLRALPSLTPIERLRPLLVRFFDQAGVGFGQLSFMQTPPAAAETLSAGYVDGMLSVAPPAGGGIHATWILWAQEEGIEPIRSPVNFDQLQPPARRVEWQAWMDRLRLPTGAAQPAVLLLHETPQGLALQTVARGIPQGLQQRSPWLDARSLFYALALGTTALALLLPAGLAWRGRVRR